MSIDKIFVSIFSVIGIIFTYWFFLMKDDREVIVSDEVDIVVDGGYSPSVISIKEGKSIKLNFFRKDSNTCLEDIVIPKFKIRTYLPLNKKITVEITPTQKGTYEFACGMNMFHGKIIVN